MESHRTGNDKRDVVTFEEAMDIIGIGYFQYKLILVGGIIILASYITSNVIAFVLPVAQCDLHMSSSDKGSLASVFFVGVLLSCHLWGFLSDTLGRRYILVRCLFLDGLLYLVTMSTPNFYAILFLRFINGITSCGGIVSAYAYVGEFQTSKFRSQSIMYASFLASFSYMLMPAVAWLILPAKWHFQLYPGQIIRPWKLFYVLCGVPSLTGAIFLYFLPESPKFLLAKGRKKEVIEILQRIYRENLKNDDVFPVTSVKQNEMEKIAKLDENQNKVYAVVKLIWNQTAPLLKKPHRFNLVLLLLSFFATVYCNNGIYVWLPPAINNIKLYKNETGNQEGTFCDVLQYKQKQLGVNNEHLHSSIGNKSDTIYKINEIMEEEICNDEVDTSVYLIYFVIGFCLTVTWVVVTFINKFFNKKYLIMVLLILSLSSVISMKVSNDLILVPVKSCIMIITSGSVFPIINSVVVDLFPTNLRAMASCLTMLTCRIGSISTHTMSGILVESHCDILLWLYIAATSVNILSVSFLPSRPPDETNNKLETNVHAA